MDELSNVLNVLSAMITPSVLILASGSLSLTTSQRLSRSIDRVRQLSEQLHAAKSAENIPEEELQNQRDFMMEELLFATRRSRYMQHAMTSIYLALTVFIATIIAIGILELSDLSFAWLLLLLGFSGISLLFFACLQLILESRLALRSVKNEMDYTVNRYLRQNQPNHLFSTRKT